MPSQLRRLRRWRSIQSFGRALAVLLEHAGLANGLAIVERALEDDVAKAFDQRAMRIALAISERVMLPVAGDPFLGHDRRGEPQPQAHGKRREVVQAKAAVRLRAMQEQRDAHVGQMTGDHDEKNRHPPSRRPNAKSRHCLTPKNG